MLPARIKDGDGCECTSDEPFHNLLILKEFVGLKVSSEQVSTTRNYLATVGFLQSRKRVEIN